MKRIVFAVLISLTSTLIQVPANASTDGCPDNWKIDLNQFPNQELLSAKEKNGINMIITESRKFLNLNGELGELPNPNALNSLFDINENFTFYYLYGRSMTEISTKVEVKNCPAKTFVFETAWKQAINFNSTTASSWANSNPQRFQDFKEQENFASVMNEAKVTVQNAINRQISNHQKFGLPLVLSTQVLDSQIPQSLRYGYRPIIRGFALTPGCLRSTKDFPSAFDFGKACQFAFGVFDGGNLPLSQAITLFEPFNLDLRIKSISITCIKGKATKKVTAIKPKCPAGFKKK
jgi:hypothetical protein